MIPRHRHQTQKHRRTYWKSTNLKYMGAGSFGTIFQLNKAHVMKIHHLREGIETCEDWKREFLLQKEAYQLCTTQLRRYNTFIARPFTFNYGAWDKNATILRQQTNYLGATSCYFTMEKVNGRLPPTNATERVYQTIAPGFNTKATLPPYLLLGALQYQISAEYNAITLDMLDGTTLIEFPRETLNYCNPSGTASEYINNITSAFFTLVEKGFIPRDVEFLLDSRGQIAIIDFNEVRKIPSHTQIPKEEIAQIYIDLCGIRRKSDRNPYYPADEPTPQWKFLCNPQTCPKGFCQLLEIYPQSSWHSDILQDVLQYTIRHLRIPDVCDWKPTKNVFASSSESIAVSFDNLFQQYIVHSLYELIQTRKITPPIITDIDYDTALSHLMTALANTNEQEEDWGFNPIWQ